MLDALDSHYFAVKNRILQLNPSRQVVGIMDAQDWPAQDVKFEALYCLCLGESPIGKQGWSPTIPIVYHTVQWTWLIAGTDTQAGIQGKSRGDRYRKNYQIEKELEYGIFPQFAQKNTYSIDGNGVLRITPVVPTEFILWTPVSFAKKSDKVSGLIYGTATTRITDMTGTIAA